jgi:hypothetical protein
MNRDRPEDPRQRDAVAVLHAGRAVRAPAHTFDRIAERFAERVERTNRTQWLRAAAAFVVGGALFATAVSAVGPRGQAHAHPRGVLDDIAFAMRVVSAERGRHTTSPELTLLRQVENAVQSKGEPR